MLKEGYSTLKYLLNENLVRKQTLEDRIHGIYTTFLASKSNVRNVIAGGSVSIAQFISLFHLVYSNRFQCFLYINI